MKRLLIAWMCVVLVSPGAWARSDVRDDGQGAAVSDQEADRRVVADVLICIDIDANDVLFHDISQKYVDAFSAAGAATIATAETEVSGGSINFPPDLTAENYPVVVVLGSDNFLPGASNIDANDEAALAAYLDSGGNLLFVAQDYMTGAHPDMNAPASCYGFPRNYLGLDTCYQDFDTPGPTRSADGEDRSTIATITGRATWIFVAVAVVILASVVFPNTGYILTDRATTTRSAGVGFDYEGEFAAGEGVLIYNQLRDFRTVWSGVELAGAETEDFNTVIAMLYHWLRTGDTPVGSTSWTALKAQYR